MKYHLPVLALIEHLPGCRGVAGEPGGLLDLSLPGPAQFCPHNLCSPAEHGAAENQACRHLRKVSHLLPALVFTCIMNYGSKLGMDRIAVLPDIRLF